MIEDFNNVELISEDNEEDNKTNLPIKRYAFLCFSITSFLFSIIFFVIIFVIWFIPIDTPNPETATKISDYFTTIVEPINSMMDEVHNISKSFIRMSIFGQGFADDVNDTIYQINNSLNIDDDAFAALSQAIDGIVSSLEGINDSLLGFLINDEIMNSAKEIAATLRLLDPEMKQIQQNILGMASNFKAFMGSIDSIDRNLSDSAKFLTNIKQTFKTLDNLLHLANEKSVMIVEIWNFIQIGSNCLSITLSIMSLIIAIYFYKRYINK